MNLTLNELEIELIKRKDIHLIETINNFKIIFPLETEITNINNDLSINTWIDKLSDYLIKNVNSIAIDGLIMVKNQENRISKCIASCIEMVDKLIIVDTGSTDNTIEKINSFESNKINLFSIPWTDDFALMRNKTIQYSTSEWVLIIDSDEILQFDLSNNDLKNVLLLLDFFNNSFDDLIVQIEAHYPQTSRFVLPDRLIRKTENIFFYGKVHEEVRSKKSMRRIQSTIKVTNYGTTEFDIKKFDKKNRYKNLLIEMINLEKDNPRWISLASPDILTNIFKKKYTEILLDHIVIDSEEPLTKDNIKKHLYTRVLLEKYIASLITNKQYSEALQIISLCRSMYPNNIDFLFYEYFIQLILLRNQNKQLLKDLLFQCAQIDNDFRVNSQKDDQLIKGLIIKILNSMGDNEKGLQIEKTLTDPFIFEFLQMNFQ